MQVEVMHMLLWEKVKKLMQLQYNLFEPHLPYTYWVEEFVNLLMDRVYSLDCSKCNIHYKIHNWIKRKEC